MVLRIQVADGPALAADAHRLRFGPEVVVNDAVQELAIGDTGCRKRHVLPVDEVVHAVDPSQVFEARRTGLLFIIAGAKPQTALQVAAQALQRAGGQHRLRQTAHTEHHVDPGAFERRHDRRRDVAVAEQGDAGANLPHLVHQGFVARAVEHDDGQIRDLHLLGERNPLQVVLHGIGHVDRTPDIRADGDLLRIHADRGAHQRAALGGGDHGDRIRKTLRHEGGAVDRLERDIPGFAMAVAGRLTNSQGADAGPAPMTMVPFMCPPWSASRIAFPAVARIPSRSRLPIQRPAESAAASVARTNSRPRFGWTVRGAAMPPEEGVDTSDLTRSGTSYPWRPLDSPPFRRPAARPP